jgi:hypothetical protein
VNSRCEIQQLQRHRHRWLGEVLHLRPGGCEVGKFDRIVPIPRRFVLGLAEALRYPRSVHPCSRCHRISRALRPETLCLAVRWAGSPSGWLVRLTFHHE